MAKVTGMFFFAGRRWISRRYKRNGEFRWATAVQPAGFPVCYTRRRRARHEDLRLALIHGVYHAPLDC